MQQNFNCTGPSPLAALLLLSPSLSLPLSFPHRHEFGIRTANMTTQARNCRQFLCFACTEWALAHMCSAPAREEVQQRLAA